MKVKGSWIALAAITIYLIIFFPKLSTATPEKAYITYTVSQGQTLWQIAQEHSKGRDIREVVYEIEEINHLSSPALVPGQKIKIPE